MTIAYGCFMIKQGLPYSVEAAIGHSPTSGGKGTAFFGTKRKSIQLKETRINYPFPHYLDLVPSLLLQAT